MSEIITYYSKNHPNKKKLNDFTILYKEENRTCWDTVTVYLKIENDIVIDWSFQWETSIITTAVSSIFWESIIWLNISEILTYDYEYIKSLLDEPISKKREKRAVIWLLATRNAIHEYLKDWEENDFYDLLPE